MSRFSTIRPCCRRARPAHPRSSRWRLRLPTPRPSRTTDSEAEEAEDSEEAEDIDAELSGTAKKKRGEEEPASFLAMYFRDMAELDVLRPEQEFETARKIEEMELDLWRTLLGFASGADWIGDTIEKAVGKPMPEVKAYRMAAEKARHKASIPMRGRFDKAAGELAAKLRGIDIDRIFLDASLAEIQRIGRATEGLPFEGHVPFATTTRIFKTYVKTVRQKALRLKAAKNEFVKANLRLVVSIARRFNHGRLPLADLIQEGNIGLMKAVERYDYRRGFRFSTYASWWIRHAISRALADKGRAVRLPVHMIDAYHRIAKSQRELQSKLERPPSTQEIAAATGIEAEKLEKMKTFLSETPVSLDRPDLRRGRPPSHRRAGRPERRAGRARPDGVDRDPERDAEAARGIEADRGRHPAQAVWPAE